MDHFEKQPRFEVGPVIKQRPFESSAVRSFFTKWCKINDSIMPQIVNRNDWEQRGIKGMLEKRSDGKQTLYIPEDLQLWEMVGVMEIVDHDTFTTKPERQNKKKEELLALGKLFQNASIYIAQRLDSIDEGKEIARALIEEFYDYGVSLLTGKQPRLKEVEESEEIASHQISDTELSEIDRFLAGENLYASRQARAEKLSATDPTKRDESYEAERCKTLAQVFRVSEKAFELDEKNRNGELQKSTIHLKTWQSDAPLHRAFLTKIEKAIVHKIETPKREFETTIFRRGLEKLVCEMKERGWKHSVNSFFKKLGIDIRIEQKKIAEVLKIAQLKSQLETIRQSEDTAKISVKEREIAYKIQKAVSRFPYQPMANNPAEMVANQYINCVGASILGGALMREAGLRYLVGQVPEHSILFLVTSDGNVEYLDMLFVRFNKALTNEMIVGKIGGGLPLTIHDIAEFSRNPKPEGLMFDIKSEKYRNKLYWVTEEQRESVTVFEPEYGQQIQVLNNTGIALSALDRKEEAIEAYRRAVALNQQFAYPYNGLGNALSALGRKEEAIEAYRKFISLSDKQNHDYWIKRAEKIIAELQNK